MMPRPLLLLALLLAAVLPSTASAFPISYEAVDLAEPPGAPDRWEYRYSFNPIAWANIPDAAGFAIYFHRSILDRETMREREFERLFERDRS